MPSSRVSCSSIEFAGLHYLLLCRFAIQFVKEEYSMIGALTYYYILIIEKSSIFESDIMCDKAEYVEMK